LLLSYHTHKLFHSTQKPDFKLQQAFDAPKKFFFAEVLLSYLRETRIFMIDKYANLPM
jgi:hypothetical protein